MKTNRRIKKTKAIASTLAALYIVSTMALTANASGVQGPVNNGIAGTTTNFGYDCPIPNGGMGLITPKDLEEIVNKANDPGNKNADSKDSGFTRGDDVYEHPEEEEEEGGLTEDQKEIIKKILGGLITAGTDTLADAIPGGKFLGEPLKAVIGGQFEGEDPTLAAIERLSQEQAKYYEDLSRRINNLHNDLGKYTEILGDSVSAQSSRNSLSTMFNSMSANLKDLMSEMKVIATSEDYTPEQKLVLLAYANIDRDHGKNYLVEVRQWADQIAATIGRSKTENKTSLDIDLYQTLVSLVENKYMFAGEAYDEAMLSAKVLTEQYMHANSLLLQCQSATEAVANFTPEQFEALGDDPEILAAYKKVMTVKNRGFQKEKVDETLERISDCIESFENFSSKKQEGNRYINNGAQKEATVLDFTIRTVDVPNSDEFRKMCKNQYFDKDGMNTFLTYIRKSGLSISDFLHKNNQTINIVANKNGGYVAGKHCYLVIDPTVTGSSKTNEEKSNFWEGQIVDYTQTIKVVDIYDPECKVVDLKVTTYERNYQYMSEGKTQNIKSYANDFIFIGAHKATEADNIKETCKTESGFEIKGPSSRSGLEIKGPTPGSDFNTRKPHIDVHNSSKK